MDVILSQARLPGSKKTAKLSAGEFSHAMLALDRNFWFDAQAAGCGFHSIAMGAVSGDDGLYLDLKPYKKLRVLRHPVMDLLSPKRRAELNGQVDAYCRKLVGSHYAQYEDLLPLVRHPLFRKPLDRKSVV